MSRPPGIVLPAALIASVTLSSLCGCVGPNKMRRALDERYNQMYVDSPVICEVSFPLVEIGLVGAAIVDFVVVNPVYFWKDAMRGRGTPYYYANPEVVEESVDE